MDYSSPDSSDHEILQARLLEGVAISSRGFPHPGIEPLSPASPLLQVDSRSLEAGEKADGIEEPLPFFLDQRGSLSLPADSKVGSLGMPLHVALLCLGGPRGSSEKQHELASGCRQAASSLKVRAASILQATKEAVLVNGSDYWQKGLGPDILCPGTEEVLGQLHFPQSPGSQGNGGWEYKIPTETVRLGCLARK